jgi:esterase/lipase superfamily enzyme
MGDLDASFTILGFSTLRYNQASTVSILNVSRSDESSLLADIASKAALSSGNALIFIHGFNNSFSDAARRTAQITYDLGFSGAPIFFSWPCKGTVTGYIDDEATIGWAEHDVRKFLSDVASDPAIHNIYIISHSMGNRAATHAVLDIAALRPDLASKIKWMILAAPDIDAGEFADDVGPRLVSAKMRVTLYSSTTDNALKLSQDLHAFPRAGDSSPPLVVSGIETVDASSVDVDIGLRHDYAFARAVMGDIYAIVYQGADAAHRFGLTEVPVQAGSYWVFQP